MVARGPRPTYAKVLKHLKSAPKKKKITVKGATVKVKGSKIAIRGGKAGAK